MKAQNISIFLLCLISLISCGAKESKVSLKISGNMSISAAGYTGGMTVTGLGPNNKSFTANAAAGTSITVDLEDGSWTFYAAGWDGAEPLDGNVYCGSLTQTLGADTSVVNITIDQASCNSATFTNGVANLADASGFNTLQIFSCASHYMGATPITAATSVSSLISGFCFSGGQPLDMKAKPGSLKIVIPGKSPTNVALTKIESTCIGYAGNYVDTLLKIPTGKIPFHFELYEDANCQELALVHEFTSGIQTAAVANGIVLNPHNSTANALFLPFSITKSGLSPMFDKLPWLSCNGGMFCPTFPAISGGADYIIPAGSNYQQGVLITRDPNLDCSNYAFSNFTGITTGICEDDDEDGVYLKFNEITYGGCQAGSCSFDQSLNASVPVTKQVRSDTSQVFHTFNDIARYMGGNPAATVSSSLDAFDRAAYSYGNLDDIRMDLGPDGVMGAFGDTPCASISGTKTLSVLDEGQLKVVQITAKNSTTTIPKAICDHTNPSATTCAAGLQTFDKQIIFRMLENSTYVTRMNMHIKCTAKLGMVESSHFDDEPGEYRDEQSLVYWNTEVESKARYETYHKEVTYSNSAKTAVTEIRNNYAHIMKTAAAADYYIFANNYEYKLAGSTVTERLFRKEIGANTGASPDIGDVSLHVEIEKPSTSTASIFSLPATQSTLDIPFLTSMMSTGPMTNFSNFRDNLDMVSESSTSHAMAFTNDQNNIKLRLFDGTNWTDHQATSVSSSVPRVSKLGTQTYITYLTPNSPPATVADIKLVMYNSSTNSLSTPITIHTATSLSSLAIGRASGSSKVDVFWVGFDSIYFKQVDASNAGDSTYAALSGSDPIVPNSLKVVPVPGSSTHLLVVWMAQVSSTNVVRSALYDSSNATQGSRFTAVSTLTGQTELSENPFNHSIHVNGSYAYYSWQTFDGTTNVHHIAKSASPATNTLTVMGTDVEKVSSSLNIGCADTTSFNTTGACAPGVFPSGANPMKPIRSGHGVHLRTMNPSVFNNLFTPLSTFSNLN